ncbi:MAG: hypothetical protein ACTSQE_14930 [Candidatus Heimdallarchaeaceae archaeon]
MKEIGITLTEEQEKKLIHDLKNHGKTVIIGFITFIVKSKKMRKMKRLDGNNAGFETVGKNKVEVGYISSIINRSLKERVL